MSTRKQWIGKEKLAIVLQGLKGTCSVSVFCNEHGITQGMYYQWRDQLLSDGAKLFERGGIDHVRERLENENRKLKETIGELTIELKNDWRNAIGIQRSLIKSFLPKSMRSKGSIPIGGYRRI